MRRCRLFIAHLERRVERSEELEQALEDAMVLARAAWPSIDLSEETFLPALAEKISAKKDPVRALAELRIEDLYLACACVEGDETAIGTFEKSYMCEVDVAVSRMEGSALVDEVRGLLFHQLLVGGESGPRLAQYAGRGDLRSWIRVAAVRRGQDLLRKNKKTTALDDARLVELASPDEDQELLYLKRLYRTEFKTAFGGAMQRLSSRERNILRLELLDGLNDDQVAAIYHVHRITIVRWKGRIRERLLAETRKLLMSRLEISKGEFESITRMIRSQLDVSMRRHLRSSRLEAV